MRKPQFFLTYLLFFSLIVTFTLSSCTQDDLISNILEDATTEEPVPDPVDPTDPTDPITTKPIGTLAINTTPCEYTLASLNANETLKIACQLNLDGQTITLPANVILEYDGGEIINGSLSFNGGKIDGALLNQNLEVSGNVTLIDPSFTFYPERWDIVQGNTNSERAQKNNNNLEDLMFFTQKIGASIFNIDSFDAYFEISKVTSTTTNQNFYNTIESVNIPSDFHLKMTDNTKLRVFPNDRTNGGVLLAVREVSNAKISGGNLIGDRDEHDYSKSNAGEGGNHLLYVHGANNITFEGIKMSMGSAGALAINSIGFTFQPSYIPSHNITVRNCIFENNRRMATAITDGYDILVENNTYIDTALDRPKSDGGVVGFALNIEAVRTRDANGNLVLYERVYDVILRGNVERGSRVGAFSIYTAENVIVENNNFENKVSYVYASGTKIRNNTFKASEKSKLVPAINALGYGETVFNNEISGNLVQGYDIGIAAYYKNLKIFENNIENSITMGIQLKQAENMEILNNKIFSTVKSSKGIMAHLTFVNDILIEGNEINVEKEQLYFAYLNREIGQEDNKVTINDNKLYSDTKVAFEVAKGIIFENNDVKGGVQLINTSNAKFNNNTINSSSSHGIQLKFNTFNVDIGNNVIKVPANSNFQCIKNESSGQVNILASNSCD